MKIGDIKCFGCSFTKYKWNTWPHFLKLSAKGHKVFNFGVPGSSNEFICREIIKRSTTNDQVIVMWSTFDRVHSEQFYKKHNHNTGKNDETVIGVTLEQLYQRTLEYIWLANSYCNQKGIQIVNLLMTILEIGETKKVNNFKRHLDIEHKNWPVDMESFCLQNRPLGKNIKDDHPSPSQHYKYFQQIICPAMDIEPIEIEDKTLKKLDDRC